MNAKQRIKKLESASGAAGRAEKFVVMFDAMEAGGLAEFDGVKMPQAEADKLAAALPDNVFLIHCCYVDYAELKNADA